VVSVAESMQFLMHVTLPRDGKMTQEVIATRVKKRLKDNMLE
jgi:hypothetical protein